MTRLLTAVVAVLLVATGCTGTGSDGATVRLAQFPWSAAKVTNAIIEQVVAAHPELGVNKIKKIQVGPATAWAGAQRGDVDALTEVAMPNQSKLAKKAADRIQMVRPTYAGAEQGWFVPSYALEPGQPLAGLKSVTQLNDYAAALGNRLVDSDPSFLTTEYNAKRLQGYHLNLEQVTSSEAAQIAELRRANERHQPILVYLYRPHYIFQEMKLTKLDEPNPPQDDCYTTGTGACAMPPYSAWTADGKELGRTLPRFDALLHNFQLPVADVEEMLKRVDVDKDDVETVARDYLAAHPDRVQEWVGQK
ncbi:glycine betaine ABC transporter substrate-binding protein [Pseudonocardia phyllosphaerae]|uniref:glycine betaine ABC transporter substrate-binding protein n=1 Tax=Pseudonocardia phyllosphaerae TaxID=3390502 RepID=UPI00397B4A45